MDGMGDLKDMKDNCFYQSTPLHAAAKVDNVAFFKDVLESNRRYKNATASPLDGAMKALMKALRTGNWYGFLHSCNQRSFFCLVAESFRQLLMSRKRGRETADLLLPTCVVHAGR